METAFPVSLVIVSALAREGLKRILTDNGFDVRQSSALPEALDAVTGHEEHIVIFESALIPSHADHALRDILEDKPHIRLILLNDHFDFDLMYQAFQAGAYGYILHETNPEILLDIIHLVSLGEKVIPPELINRLHDIPTAAQSNFFELHGFGERDKAILDCLVLGMPNKIIARKINVSEATVKMAIKGIFRKLNVTNRTQAAILARDALSSFQDIERTIPQESDEHLRRGPIS